MKYEIDLGEIVDRIIGEINPIGETNTDDARYENLEAYIDVCEHMIRKIYTVSQNANRQEFSIKRAGKCAKEYLAEYIGEEK